MTHVAPALAVAGTVSSAIGALALTSRLGAPSEPVCIALELLCFIMRGLDEYKLPTPKKRKTRRKRRVRREEPAVSTHSSWDPDPHEEQMDVSRCRALLLEIVRRAAHDWILYRTHSDMQNRQMAEEAYIWLFEEGPGHLWWDMRERSGHTITSFLTICELLDLDPAFVRRHIKGLTVKQIMTAGRPAERRRRPSETSTYTEHAVDSRAVGALEENNHESSQYEAHFSVSTLEYQ